MNKIKIIAEIGINHNGDLTLAKDLIMLAKTAGCDYVKLQKRNPDVCVPEDQKQLIRKTPWGEITYLEYKWKLEFNENEYDELFDFCRTIGIKLFASVWDKPSADFMAQYTDLMKIPSALINDIDLCCYVRKKAGYLMVSTGMSTEIEIENCINACNPDVIFHTNSTYPTPVKELNLNYITHLKEKYSTKEIGYSGHEYGLVTTFATIPMGVTWIERHITMDREMWGSDQKASVEPSGLIKLVKGIRDIESALSLPATNREVFGGELEKLKSLRK